MIGQIVLAHLVGDYLLQSDWMATEKTKRWWPAILHGVLYTLPFVLITQSWQALAVISSTHVVIDRFRLARHIGWLKNWMAPIRVRRASEGGAHVEFESYNPPWDECRATGYPKTKPAWMAVWLMIIADNTIHLLVNVAAVRWL